MWVTVLIIIAGAVLLALLLKVLKADDIGGVKGAARLVREVFTDPDAGALIPGEKRQPRKPAKAAASEPPDDGDTGTQPRADRKPDLFDDFFRPRPGQPGAEEAAPPTAGTSGTSGTSDMGEIPVGTAPPSGAVQITGIAVPPAWALLCAMVADADLHNDEALLEFFKGQAAGFHAYSKAMGILAEHLGTGRKLDSQVVRKIFEAAELVPEVAEVFIAVPQAFNTRYGGVEEDISDRGLELPVSSQSWLTGASG